MSSIREEICTNTPKPERHTYRASIVVVYRYPWRHLNRVRINGLYARQNNTRRPKELADNLPRVGSNRGNDKVVCYVIRTTSSLLTAKLIFYFSTVNKFKNKYFLDSSRGRERVRCAFPFRASRTHNIFTERRIPRAVRKAFMLVYLAVVPRARGRENMPIMLTLDRFSKGYHKGWWTAGAEEQ